MPIFSLELYFFSYAVDKKTEQDIFYNTFIMETEQWCQMLNNNTTFANGHKSEDILPGCHGWGCTCMEYYQGIATGDYSKDHLSEIENMLLHPTLKCDVITIELQSMDCQSAVTPSDKEETTQDLRPPSTESGVQIQTTDTVEEVPASILRQRFKIDEKTFQLKKPTNIPKFLYKQTMDVADSVSFRKCFHLWLQSIRKKLPLKEKDNTSSRKASRFALLELLQPVVRDNSPRIEEKFKLRQELQRKLTQGHRDKILANDAIPKTNKDHYLYWSKIYQWRLNDPRLLNNLT